MCFSCKKKLLRLRDPLHIGNGEMKLGIVDNSLIRNINNQEPEIPGATFVGNYREFIRQWGKSHAPLFLRNGLKRKISKK